MLSSANDEKSQSLMRTLDNIRQRFGAEACQPGTAGIKPPKTWQMQRGNVSGRFTSQWDELPTVGDNYSHETFGICAMWRLQFKAYYIAFTTFIMKSPHET